MTRLYRVAMILSDEDYSRLLGLRTGHEFLESPARSALEQLRESARQGRVVLVTAIKDIDRSAGAVLQEVMVGR